jgi:hypothetical protein
MTPHAPGECPGVHSPGKYTADQCRVCWLAGAAATAAPPGPVPEPPPPVPDCIELGPALPDQSCGCLEKLRKCAIHGTCTTYVQRDKVACCRLCPDHAARSF